MATKAPGADMVSTVSSDVDDAVGVEKCYWYVALVNNNSEKCVAEKLNKLGIKNYLPIQQEHRVWKNGRKVKIDRVVIPSMIFICCTESERRDIVCLPFINRFMVNKAGDTNNVGNKPLATIPDMQIETLRFMLGNSDSPVTFFNSSYKKGDVVRVIRGKLLGLIGEVQKIDDKHSEIIVNLDCIGNARLAIETINVEPYHQK